MRWSVTSCHVLTMPTTMRAEKPPARRATCSASRAERLAAALTRTFARTDTHMPTKPAAPEHSAPSRKEPVVSAASVDLHVKPHVRQH